MFQRAKTFFTQTHTTCNDNFMLHQPRDGKGAGAEGKMDGRGGKTKDDCWLPLPINGGGRKKAGVTVSTAGGRKPTSGAWNSAIRSTVYSRSSLVCSCSCCEHRKAFRDEPLSHMDRDISSSRDRTPYPRCIAHPWRSCCSEWLQSVRTYIDLGSLGHSPMFSLFSLLLFRYFLLSVRHCWPIKSNCMLLGHIFRSQNPIVLKRGRE
jgi:hypothetical protein